MFRRIVLALMALFVLAAVVGAAALYVFLSGDGVRRTLEQQATAWLGQPVHIESASARLLPRPAIDLANVRVGDPAALTLARIRVSTDLRALLERRIEQAEVVVADSRIQMPLPFARPTASASPAASRDAPITLVSVRTIELENVTLLSRGRAITVDADSALDGSRLQVRRFRVRSGDSAFEATGIAQLTPRLDVTLRAKANVIDVDELIALADAFTPEGQPTERRGEQGPRIAARVSAERARAGGVEVRQFAAELVADGDRLSLSPLSFQVFGGRYQGALVTQLGTTLEAKLDSRFMDIDVAQLAAFGGAEGTATGRLSGSGTFSGRGADLSVVLQSARGQAAVSVVDGTIQRLDLIRTVILFFGRPAPDTAVATDAFNRIDASVTLADQVVTATAFALQSRDADIVGSGTLDLEGKGLNGRLDLSLSEELTAQAGTDLQRYTMESGRIVLPATLGGALGQPRLRIDAAAAVKRGFRNEVQRRLGGLLEQLGGK